MSKYYSIHEFSKIIGVSAQTLRNWDANGKLHPHHTTVSGYRYYSDEQLNQVINVKPKNRITIGYCRVFSHKQKDDLERQIEIIDNTEKSEQQELVEDLVQVITVFSCKLQGKRANKAKKLIRELIQEEADGKSHKSNADTKQCTEN
ncbi:MULTISPECIES: MerR family transcriptional regulator [Clostridia]|uniref:MerR family transcriptional regulator n=1 Tax=Clostridia TaxID=186801 RepID=UPI0018979750|nr:MULTISPECIES: MerR family transcriptional regulator [Clostridia]MCB5434097.1 MerR family transcriptional regulator [Blautia faecis]MCB6580892.1 MerR family transcriptional regulator [Blautia faecis]MCB7293100.1 MerR family transcriptional regulator [Blautia faecis]MCG4845166.1 MerR family transcriptional regulator [Blautia faecis]